MIVITGGSGSGKSLFGEKLATDYNKVLYIATAAITDEEMKQRVQNHKIRRPPHWDTYEGYQNLPDVLEQKGTQYDCILLECITTWCTNLLLEEASTDIDLNFSFLEEKILQEANRLIQAIKHIDTQCIIITNEVGLGIVPETKLGRNFRDLQGKINQLLFQHAAKSFFVVAGQPVLIKEEKEYTADTKKRYPCPRLLKPFFLSLSFFTALPCPVDLESVEQDYFSKSIFCLPFIGFLLGLIQYGCYLAFVRILPPMAATALALFTGILCTGGFHLDGLADTCDGLFSGQSRERKLAIMKDSRIGVHGSLGLMMDILLKFTLLYCISSPIAYCMAPIAGRLSIPVLSYHAHYPRKNGLGNLFIGKVPFSCLCSNILLSCLLCFALSLGTMPLPLIAIVVTFGVLWCIKKSASIQLGGITGDILGAGVECGEIVFLLSLLVLEGFL